MLTRDAGWPSLDHRCEGPLCIARITIRGHCGVVARARCMAGPALMCLTYGAAASALACPVTRSCGPSKRPNICHSYRVIVAEQVCHPGG